MNRTSRTRGGLVARIAVCAGLAMAGAGILSPTHAAPTAEGAAPPYDTDLMRLSEILGALHYLRPLCGANGEAQRWRNEMQSVIETEQPSDARRGQMIASFNRGFSSFAQVYRSCTPAARLAIERHLEEGARLAHDIVVRFGGN